MTTSSERTRALLWAREVLVFVASEPSVSRRLQARASTLLQDYPTAEQFDVLIAEGNAAPARCVLDVLGATGALITEAGCDPAVDLNLVDALRRTLRHFPSSGEIDWWGGGNSNERIRRDVAPTDAKAPGLDGSLGVPQL